jgi:hypothetical protein
LVTFVCRFLLLSSGDTDDGCQWKSQLLCAAFHTRARRRRRVAEGGLHLSGEVDALNHRVKCFRKYVLSFEAPSASRPCNLSTKV